MTSTLGRALLLIVLALVLAIGAYFLFGYLSGDTASDIGVTEDQTIARSVVSSDAAEATAEFRHLLYIENNPAGAYEVIKDAALDTMAENAQRSEVDTIELNDEMQLAAYYAAIALEQHPEEALRLYAQIYRTERYPGWFRAEALYSSLAYLHENLGHNISLEQARQWVFADGLFGSILNDEEFSGHSLDSIIEARLALSIGLKQIESLADSNRVRTRAEALQYTLETEKILEERKSNLDADEVSLAGLLDEILVVDVSGLELVIIAAFNNENRYPRFTPEFVYAAEDVLRLYATLHAAGLDLTGHIGALSDATREYLNRYRLNSEPTLAVEVDAHLGTVSLLSACLYALTEDYDPADVLKTRSLEEMLQPFLRLSAAERERFSGLDNVRRAGPSDPCYEPYLTIGQGVGAFGEALREAGWPAN